MGVTYSSTLVLTRDSVCLERRQLCVLCPRVAMAPKAAAKAAKPAAKKAPAPKKASVAPGAPAAGEEEEEEELDGGSIVPPAAAPPADAAQKKAAAPKKAKKAAAPSAPAADEEEEEELDGGSVVPPAAAPPADLFGDHDPAYAAASAVSPWLPPGRQGGKVVCGVKRGAAAAAAAAAEIQPPPPPPPKRAAKGMAFVKAGTSHSEEIANTAPEVRASGGADAGAGVASGSSAAVEMMKSMGYTEGSGLGRSEQGVASAVEAHSHIGTLGLGFELGDGGAADGGPLPPEPLGADETDPLPLPSWVGPCSSGPPDAATLASWLEEGPRLESIDDETEHVSAAVLGAVLRSKSALDHIKDRRAFNDARTRSNPFEAIRKEFFINRAALKMAAMDAAFGALFSGADAADLSECVGGRFWTRSEPSFGARGVKRGGGRSSGTSLSLPTRPTWSRRRRRAARSTATRGRRPNSYASATWPPAPEASRSTSSGGEAPRPKGLASRCGAITTSRSAGSTTARRPSSSTRTTARGTMATSTSPRTSGTTAGTLYGGRSRPRGGSARWADDGGHASRRDFREIAVYL